MNRTRRDAEVDPTPDEELRRYSREVRKRIREIKDYAARGLDDEAHSTEDRLREDVLATIANPHVRLAESGRIELARLALLTSKIEFGRWTA